MALAIPPKIRTQDYGVMSALEIDDKQCQEIIDLHKDSRNFHKKGKIQTNDSNVVNLKKRDVDAYVIHEDFAWVDLILCTAAMTANQTYEFNLTGLIERPQLLRYTAPSEGYDWHLDIGTGDHSTRKISISVALNDGYKGGELTFFMTGAHALEIPKGTAIAFPSFFPHRVEPVTEGERWSLVCWMSGDPFR